MLSHFFSKTLWHASVHWSEYIYIIQGVRKVKSDFIVIAIVNKAELFGHPVLC